VSWRGLAFVVGALVACGGSVAAGPTDAGSDSAADREDDATGGSTCAPGGVRICAPAAGCPAIPGSSCPGTGCVDVDTVDGGSTDDGVCWTDLADLGDVSCAACDDGQSCIRRAGVFRCVPDDVCNAFWAIGIEDVCVYADKHVYNGSALPAAPTTCPVAAGRGALCGGACGACLGDEAQRCIGRSPDHPVGVCAWLPAVSDPHDPSTIPTCSITGGSYDSACPAAPAGLVCGVFSAAAALDVALAKQYGLCMPIAMCQTIAANLPGGFGCYDAAASLVAGE
jgi:hypothetical protein